MLPFPVMYGLLCSPSDLLLSPFPPTVWVRIWGAHGVPSACLALSWALPWNLKPEVSLLAACPASSSVLPLRASVCPFAAPSLVPFSHLLSPSARQLPASPPRLSALAPLTLLSLPSGKKLLNWADKASRLSPAMELMANSTLVCFLVVLWCFLRRGTSHISDIRSYKEDNMSSWKHFLKICFYYYCVSLPFSNKVISILKSERLSMLLVLK